MTDLAILFTTAPLALLAFSTPLDRALVWVAAGLAAAFHGYWIATYQLGDLAPLAAVVGCLSLFVLEVVSKKSANGILLLGTLFVGQALLSKEVEHVLVLLIASDTLFCAEAFFGASQQNRQGFIAAMLRSLWAYAPVALAILLRLEGTPLLVLAGITMIGRVSSWPVSNSLLRLGRERRGFLVAIAGAGSFALWKNLVPSAELDWPTAWFCAAALLSLGATARESAVILSFGVFNLGSPWSFLVAALWPTLIFEGALSYVLTLLVACMGSLIVSGFSKLLTPEAGYGISLGGALLLARVLAGTATAKPNWVLEGAAAAFTVGLAGFIVWLFPEMQFPLLPEVGVFAGSLLFFFIVGKFVVKQRPKIFGSAKPLSIPVLKTGSFQPVPLKVIPVQDKKIWRLFGSFESDAYLGFLLGLAGAALLWGLQ